MRTRSGCGMPPSRVSAWAAARRRPDALLERAAQLGLMRGAHDVVALVLERGIEEEAVVLELEVLVVLTDARPCAG